MISIPINEQNLTDAEVFAAFDFTCPGLKKVQAALDAGALSTAKEELVRYFETRTNVQYYYDYRKLPLRPIDTDSNPYLFQAALGLEGSLKDFCLFAGRKLMQHIYIRPGRERQELDLGSHYQNLPHFNYYEDQGKKHRTTLDIFVRGQFFEYLSVLYHETGDPAVIDYFKEILSVFFKQYPLIVASTEPDTSRFSFLEERDVMSTGWLALSYVSLLYTRLPYEISSDLAFEIIKRIWFLGVQFRRFDTDGYQKFNHHMWERGLVPFILGTLFPELPDLKDMRERGAKVVRQHILDDFSQEGGYSEHSLSYWSGAALAEMVCRGAHLARLNNVSLLDAETESRINRSFDILTLLSPPGESYPSLGDNGGTSVDPILQSGISSMDNACCRELLDLREGKISVDDVSLPLDYCSDRTGFFCTRSSYRRDANYLLMSAKINCGDTGHNHMDPLSLFITVHGQDFIGEPHARHLYHSACIGSPLRGYLYNMESHNTVLAFGNPIQQDYFYASKWGVLRPDTPVTAFRSEKEGCFVSAYHDAYTFCRHRRSILNCRRKGFLIHDEVIGGDRLPTEHIQRWHLLPDVEIRQLNDRSLLLEKNGAKALCIWCGSPRLHLWQKPELTPPSTIVDVHFAVENFVHPGDIGVVAQDFLILDATDHMPAVNDPTEFCQNMIRDAEDGRLSDALNYFSES